MAANDLAPTRYPPEQNAGPVHVPAAVEAEAAQCLKEVVYFIDEEEAGFSYLAHNRKAAHQWLDAMLDNLADGEDPVSVLFKRRDMTKAEIDTLPEI